MKAIRKATVQTLSGLGIPVHDSKVSPQSLSNLPCTVVWNEGLGLDSLGIKNQFSGFKDVQIKIDLVVAQSESEYADTLDDLVELVIQTLSTDTTYLSNWIAIEGFSVSYQYITEYDKPLAIASVTISGKK